MPPRLAGAVILMLVFLALPSAAVAAPELVGVGSFDEPVYVTAPPREYHRLFVVERAGRVRLVKDGKVVSNPFLDISADVDLRGEGGHGGLHSIAFPRNYKARAASTPSIRTASGFGWLSYGARGDAGPR